jgi:hypothetical protein
MKPERFRRTKSVVASSAIALVIAALVVGLSSLVIGPRSASPERLGFELTSSSCIALTPPNFAVCGPAAGHGPVVNPGAPASTLPLTFYNPLSAALSITSLTVNFTNAFPSGCPASGFRLAGTMVSGSAPTISGTQPNVTFTFPAGHQVTVPGGSVGTPGTSPYNLTLALLESGGNQKNCKGLPLTMNLTAGANYTDGTSTILTSSPNPSALGQSVIFTATVTANNAATDPIQPSGTVSFYKCTSASVCPNAAGNLLGTGTIGAGGKAMYPTTASQLTQGLNYVDAVYPNSSTNFTGSTSNVVTQDVGATTTTALTSAPNPSTSGQSVTFTATVTKTGGTGTPSGNVNFYSGTPTGTHTLLATKAINVSGVATYSTSASPPLSLGTDPFYAAYVGDTNFLGSTSPVYDQTVASAACINGTINGGYTVAANQVICITGRVNGGVTVKSGGSLILSGATINGGTLSATSPGSITICNSTINGNITISGATKPVLIGDGGDTQPAGDDPLPACDANTLNASSISLTNNIGGVEFGGNKVTGSVTISNNTNASGPEVEGNKITGSLACSGNVAGPTNDTLKNTVTGTKSGQCAGSSF